MEDTNGKSNPLKNFTPALDMLLAKYGPVTAIVYGYIWRRSQGERKRCDANRTTIKRLLHIDEKTFTTHARKLAAGGYIKFIERGNSSTIYWPTGKAEVENRYFSVENFPTKRGGSVEIFPGSRENFPGSGENFPAQQGNFPYEESIEESKKERNDDGRSSSRVTNASSSNSLSKPNTFEKLLADKLGQKTLSFPTAPMRSKLIDAGERLGETSFLEAVDAALVKIPPYEISRIVDWIARWESRGKVEDGGQGLKKYYDASGNEVWR